MSYSSNLHHLGGAPIVALHSSASNGGQWSALAADIDDRQRFIAIDLPGYDGLSKRPCDANGMAAIADPIIEHIKKLKEPVHLVGHSFGGGVALKIALTSPELVRSLTLYEPVAFQLMDPTSPADRHLLAPLQSIAAQLEGFTDASNGVSGMSAFIDFWNGQGSWQNLSAKQQGKITAQGPVVLSDLNHSMSENWAADELQAIDVPTQIIMGMESPTLAQRMSTIVYEHINHAELVMLPGLGQMAPLFAPDWVNPRIRRHIARTERGIGNFSWPQRNAA